MKKWWKYWILGSVILIAVSLMVVGEQVKYRVLAGRMSISLNGAGAHWVEPSAVKVKLRSGGSVEIPFRLYNNSSRTRIFNLEKVTPYDASIWDIGECIFLPTQSIELDGKTEGTFLVQVGYKDALGESWIRITTDDPRAVQSVLIIRVRVG